MKRMQFRLAALFRKRALDADMNAEIRSHIELATQEKIEAGMNPDEARFAALRQFGWAETFKETCREERSIRWMENLAQDIRFGTRQLFKNPGFTSVAVLTLALGIGANAAIFSVIYGVLIEPLPYRDPEQLVRLFESSASQPKFPMSPADFQDYRQQNSTLAGLALYTRQDLELSKDDQPELLSALRITSGFFEVLGVRPMLGREFLRDDEAPGNHHAVILSHGLWQRRFSGDPNIVGKPVLLTGEAFTVVGVVPPGVQHVGGDYRSMPHGETVDFWWPMTLRPGDDRGSHYLNAIARVKPGIRPEQAAADLNVIAERLARQFPETNGSFHIVVQALRQEIVERARTLLLVLFGAVFLVLLIACVNVANLLLARASAREREMAVRTAVGAGRWRIVRQLLAESLLLASVSSAAGMLLAEGGIVALRRFGPEQLPRVQTVHLDGHVLLFTVVLTLLTGVLFGLAPAWQAGKADISELLSEGGRAGIGRRHGRLRDGLVTVEVALALALLVGTGLLARSFLRVQQTAAGFKSERILTALVSLPYTGYGDPKSKAVFQQRLLDRLAALPGIESAGLTSDLPWTGYDENNSFYVEGKTFPDHDGPEARYHAVSFDYFRTLGTPLRAGRFFNEDDRMDKPQVLLINQSMADRYWPGESAVGKRITFNSAPKDNDWLKIVGVVGDVKDRPDSVAAVPAFYWSLAQAPIRQVTLVVRTSADPSTMIAAVRQEIYQLDRTVPLADVKTLETITGKAIAGRRFALWLMGGFAATSLTLAAIGIYGVLSYLVAQRTREIGARMALGAQAGDVVRLTLSQGMRLTLIGVALGLAGAFVFTRSMSSLLFGVGATDLITFAGSALLLTVVALLSCWLPARRAAKVDPMAALRAG